MTEMVRSHLIYTTQHTHNTTQPFYGSVGFVGDNLGEPVPEGTFRHLLDFLEQNEDNTGRTHQQSGWIATQSRLIGAPTSAIPTIFTQDALPYTTLPIYPGLGQAPNMLACISHKNKEIRYNTVPKNFLIPMFTTDKQNIKN